MKYFQYSAFPAEAWRSDTHDLHVRYRVSQKKRSFRISKPLGPTDASGDNSVGKGCWRDVG